MSKLSKGLGKGLKISLPALPKSAGMESIQNPLKAGTSITVKTPKTKQLPKPTDKPSKFFKNEQELENIKHPSIRKLRDFILKKHRRH